MAESMQDRAGGGYLLLSLSVVVVVMMMMIMVMVMGQTWRACL